MSIIEKFITDLSLATDNKIHIGIVKWSLTAVRDSSWNHIRSSV